MSARPPNSLRPLLAGGDRRSIARSDRARALVLAEPARVAELAALTEDSDWLVAMRALDLLEKLAHDHPDWVAPHRSVSSAAASARDASGPPQKQVMRASPGDRGRQSCTARRSVGGQSAAEVQATSQNAGTPAACRAQTSPRWQSPMRSHRASMPSGPTMVQNPLVSCSLQAQFSSAGQSFASTSQGRAHRLFARPMVQNNPGSQAPAQHPSNSAPQLEHVPW